ncbi:MAG: HAD family hydrolase [Deltaproteobacteria bacterium]|nr:HAD family hydrolase [Deltaproteobacteria bacterium]
MPGSNAAPLSKVTLGWIPKLAMFDLDGTLIDTMGHFANLAATLIEENYEVFDSGGAETKVTWALARERYLQTSGIPLRQQLEVIFPGDKRNDPVAATYERDKTEICLHAEFPLEVAAALRELQARGVPVIISSNSAQHFVDELAARAPVDFDLALGFGDGVAKGEPHVERVVREFSVEPEDILFCGDSLKDGELAERCGQRFVGVIGTFNQDAFEERFEGVHTVESIAHLPALIWGP